MTRNTKLALNKHLNVIEAFAMAEKKTTAAQLRLKSDTDDLEALAAGNPHGRKEELGLNVGDCLNDYNINQLNPGRYKFSTQFYFDKSRIQITIFPILKQELYYASPNIK